ncbi:hypothetical protein GCM10025868_06410 [Angustibacter aerolatus]|uniref:Uncharacterized protein n=1 Tax=Angustibacter aerolatus TaxID=1162965 RepID=A0ABQ6JB27_9ACTN|nr:hypothetical protein GCM10025868_06410 [Angustibacter aerolatus]
MPPLRLDVDVQPADDVGEQLAVAAAAERGVEVDEVHPLRPARLPGQRGVEGVAVGRLAAGLALHQAHRPPLDHVDGGQQPQRGQRGRVAHAGGLLGVGGPGHSDRTQFSSSLRAGVAALLGVELGRRQGALLDGGHEPRPVRRPGDVGLGEARVGDLQPPVLHGVGVHEVEPLRLDAGEQPAARCGLDGVPAGVRDDGRREPLDRARPLAEALAGVEARLGRAVEEHLVAHAHPEHRSVAGQPAVDHLVAAHRAQPGDAGVEVAHAGHHEAVAVHRGAAVGGHSTSAPTRSSARTAERTLPEP